MTAPGTPHPDAARYAELLQVALNPDRTPERRERALREASQLPFLHETRARRTPTVRQHPQHDWLAALIPDAIDHAATRVR